VLPGRQSRLGVAEPQLPRPARLAHRPSNGGPHREVQSTPRPPARDRGCDRLERLRAGVRTRAREVDSRRAGQGPDPPHEGEAPSHGATAPEGGSDQPADRGEARARHQGQRGAPRQDADGPSGRAGEGKRAQGRTHARAVPGFLEAREELRQKVEQRLAEKKTAGEAPSSPSR
jgi:hypothetical protein